MAEREPLDSAVLDLDIRGKESYPVAKALAARSVPFVFVTGYTERRLREPFSSTPLLQKPIAKDDLRKTLEQLQRNAARTPSRGL